MWWQHPAEGDDAFALQRLRRRPDELIDRVVQGLASDLDVPICAVAILGDTTEWILSGVGVGDGDLHRSLAFSNLPHAEVIPDARLHAVLGGHPWVEATPMGRTAIVEPIDLDGQRIGALVAMDVVVRDFGQEAAAKVRSAMLLVSEMLVLRRSLHRVADAKFNCDAFARHLIHVVAGPNRRAAMCARLAREAIDSDDLQTADTYLGYVEEQTAHAQRLVTELARFLHPDPEIEIGITDIAESVWSSWRTVSPDTLTLALQLDEPHMQSSATHLTSAFTELFRNAQMHGGSSVSTVTVWSRRVQGVVTIGVEDDGVGVAPAMHAEITKPLVRGPIRQPGSFGLGLAEVQRAVHSWKGQLQVGGRASGTGLSVVFTECLLPVSPASPVPGHRRREPPQ